MAERAQKSLKGAAGKTAAKPKKGGKKGGGAEDEREESWQAVVCMPQVKRDAEEHANLNCRCLLILSRRDSIPLHLRDLGYAAGFFVLP